jgi:hypothetical protein
MDTRNDFGGSGSKRSWANWNQIKCNRSLCKMQELILFVTVFWIFSDSQAKNRKA